MIYAITDILLKVAFSPNKTGHQVLRYIWHIIERVLLVFNDTFNNVSGRAYNMVTSFIGV
jgi:hypothetical protein